jgi:hypothetical protein
MAVVTYDDSSATLHDILQNSAGVSQTIADYITNHVTYVDYSDGAGPVVPVEFITGRVAIGLAQDHLRVGAVCVLNNRNRVQDQCRSDPALKFIVQTDDLASASLNVTGSKAGVGIYGAGADTITSSSSGAHESIWGGDAAGLQLTSGSGLMISSRPARAMAILSSACQELRQH